MNWHCAHVRQQPVYTHRCTFNAQQSPAASVGWAAVHNPHKPRRPPARPPARNSPQHLPRPHLLSQQGRPNSGCSPDWHPSLSSQAHRSGGAPLSG